MGDKRLYSLRYRDGRKGIPPADFLEVDVQPTPEGEMALAEAIGRAFCQLEQYRLYIGVKPTIVADKRLLTDEQYAALTGGAAKAAKASVKVA